MTSVTEISPSLRQLRDTLHWLPLLQRIIFSLTLRWSCVRLRQLKMQDLEYAGRGNKNDGPNPIAQSSCVSITSHVLHHFQGQNVKGQLAGAGYIVAASRTACHARP